MNKKLFSRVLIIIIILVVIAVFYFVFKDTKRINVSNIQENAREEVKEIHNDNKLPDDSIETEATGQESEAKNEQVEEEVINNVEVNKKTVTSEDVKQEEEKQEEEVVEKSVNPPNITNKLISWGYQSANRSIDTIVIHSSYDALGDDPYDLDGIIDEYKQYGVGAHYLMDRKGKIYQLVQDKNIAYHAGVGSVPDGRTDVNNFSIGIELMNTKDGKFTDAQYGSLNKLIDYLKSRYKIKYTLGHNQIAPGRKDDPWNFKWSKLE